VREAGGIVTNWDGDPESWLNSGNILAGPPAVHAVLSRIASGSAEPSR
jgi:myo-inositol-1(or 4)-monophosphatase